MSVVDTLIAFAAGGHPAKGLLHTARLAAFGVEVYGEEAIVERFRCAPFDLSNSAKIVAALEHIAIFDAHKAVFADVCGDNIARIWYLGEGDPGRGEPQVSVAFDPDLAQGCGDVFVAASDHPALAAGAIDSLTLAGRTLARADDPEDSRSVYRTRAFVIRAFGTAIEGAALFAVYRLTGEPVRGSGFAMAAARWTPDGLQIVRDRAGEAAIAERPWTPHIGA